MLILGRSTAVDCVGRHHLYVASVSRNLRRVPIPNSVRQARTKRTVRSRTRFHSRHPLGLFFTPSTIKRECVRGCAGARVCVRVAVARLVVVTLRRFHWLRRCR